MFAGSLICGLVLIILSLMSYFNTKGLDDGFSPPPVFKAASGSCKITPSQSVALGGYANRSGLSDGVHDDLFARCLILESPDGQRLALVSLDLVGFLRYDVLMVKKELSNQKIIDPDSVFIFSTHNHSGPDTIGIWGINGVSGRDEQYLAETRKKIVELIEFTGRNLEEAHIYVAQTSGEGLSVNQRISGELDETITAILVKSRNKNIAALVNFGCHPESLGRDNRLITADFPGYLAQKLEKELGCTALFANGLLGGMVSVNKEYFKIKDKSFERAEETGNVLAERVLDSINSAKHIKNFSLKIQRKTIAIPLTNLRLQAAMRLNLIPISDETFDQNRVLTEVGIISLGEMKIILVPGEMTPGLGAKIKTLMPSARAVIFGLTNDEIGYILPSEDFDSPLYKYERTMSLGQSTGDIIYQALKELAAQ